MAPFPITADIIEYINYRVMGHSMAWQEVINTSLTDLNSGVAGNARDMDIAWLIICGALVFFMQAGFAMLEAGIVHPKNVTNILFKNMIDASIAAICMWTIGYAFAFGPTRTGVIGYK